jgi:hypothetical protein
VAQSWTNYGIFLANRKALMEIRVSIDDEFARQLQERLGVKKATEVVKSAMTLLAWAADEASQGRVILSSDATGGNLRQLVMPGLGVSRTTAPGAVSATGAAAGHAVAADAATKS